MSSTSSSALPVTGAPTLTVFGPDPLLSITIERRGEEDDVHLHAAGQGVWVARMAAELGATPILCGFIGGETGDTLSPLLERIGGELRLVRTEGSSGSYVVDRRGGERRTLARALRPAPRRHELDDLVAATCASALASGLLVICNPFPASGIPEELYATVAANVRAAGVRVVVDLSSPRLEQTLPFGPTVVKLNDWELAEYVCGPVDGPRAVDAARRLIEAGAHCVVVTRAGSPILLLDERSGPSELVPPEFPHGFREGCGDAMTGALAAGLARGQPLPEALLLGAAAGTGNFLRHGLGTGRRDTVEALVPRIAHRPLTS